MNKVFKKVFNAARGMMMVVNETTSSVQTGKKAAVTVAALGALASAGVHAASVDLTEPLTDNLTIENVSVNSNGMTEAFVVKSASADDKKSLTLHYTNDSASVALRAGTGDGHNGADIIISDLDTFTVTHDSNVRLESGALLSYMSGAAYADNNRKLKLENIDTVNIGTSSNVLSGIAVNAFSSIIEMDVGTLNIHTTSNAITTNAQSPDCDPTVDIKADHININVAGSTAIYSGMFKKGDMTTSLTAKTITIQSAGGSMISLNDQGNTGTMTAVLDASESITMSGANTALSIKSTNADTTSTMKLLSDGDITVNANVSAVSFSGAKAGQVSGVVEGQNVTLTSKTNSAVALDKADLVVKAGKAVLNTESDYYAIDVKNGGTATIDADVIEASSTYAGVIARSSTVTLGNDASSSVKISATGQGYLGNLYGLWAYDRDSTITVKGQKLEITAQGDEGVGGTGILAQALVGAGETGGNRVIVDAQNTLINASNIGISVMGKGRVDINGGLTVNAPDAILARGESVVNVNTAGGKTVVLNGDVNFNKGDKSGTNAWADVNLVLDTADSVWNGTVKATWDVPATAEDFRNSKLNLTLKNGAQWNPTAVATTGELQDAAAPAMFRMVRAAATGGQMGIDISKLTLDDGVINLPDGVEVGVGELDGTGTLNIGVGEDGTTGAGLNVGQATEGSALDVTLMNGDLTQELTSDDITADQAAAILGAVDGVETTATVKEGFENGEITVGADGTTKVAANTLMTNALDLATAAPLAINRLLMNDVRKRLGDLRSAEGTHGVWARYDGGRLSGAMGLENDFHTLQAGIDTVPTADSARFGVALSYTKSDADMKRGGAEMDAFGLAVYGTKFYDNGLFVDVIGRLAKTDTDLTIDGQVKGSMDNLAVSLSGEAGWRFNMTERHYVEPQVEVTYTRVDNGSLQLDNGTTYEFDSVDSVIGRAGFAAGFTCPNKMGDVYVRASVVREFMGDAGIAVRNGKPREVNGSDTWFEYGIGANFNVNKSTYVYADIERTSGAALDEDWRANVGVRYSF